MALASSEATVRMPAAVALHARPAGVLVRTAAAFSSHITVAAGERSANARSILAILALGATGGTTLSLRAEAEDAAAAVAALASCVSGLIE